MFLQRRMAKRAAGAALALLLAAAAFLPLFGGRAEAGKEGVFLSDSVYFTLEEARLSPGSDTGTFRFTLELVNGSEETIDYNRFGAAVWDSAGNRYSAELAERTSARVPAGSSKKFKYVSKVPAGAGLQDLQTEIFEWNFDSPGYMDSLGKLSVAAAAETSQSDKPQVVVNMNDLDASYPSDALVSFELQRSYRALANGSWSIYADIWAENLGSTGFKLPAPLQVNVTNGGGLTFAGSVVYGGDKPVLPHQKSEIILQFPVGDLNDQDGLTLQFAKKPSGSSGSSANAQGTGTNNSGNAQGTGTNNSGNAASSAGASNNGSASQSAASQSPVVLGSLELTGSLAALKTGDVQSDWANRNGLSAVVESVNLDSKSDGLHAESVFTLTNKGKTALSVPTLPAFYQVGPGTLGVSANESAAHPAFLAPGESTTYYYNAVLPGGVEGSNIQLVVQERKTENPVLDVPAFIAQLPDSSNSSAPAASGGNAYRTPAGKLGLTVKSSYRLQSDGGNDVLMTELQVENLEATAVKLPQLYAGYTDSTNDIEGKAVIVQSSPYLNPGQKTTLYLFAEIPYDLQLPKGKLYFGQGTLDPKTNTWTQKKEWARLPYEIKATDIGTAAVGVPWYVNDPGRISVANVVEMKLYDKPETSESGLQAAVRIEQKSQMARNGTVVPYTGYLLASDGSVYPLQATQETGKLSKDGKALTTLWAEVPAGVLDDKAEVVFGQQIDGQAFASPKKMLFAVTPNEPSNTDDQTWKINASLYPYKVKFGSMTRIYESRNQKYTFQFPYKLEKSGELTGSGKNRFLHFELEDSVGTVVKSWDVPLEGNGAMEDGTQTLDVKSSEIPYADDFLNGSRLKVYEKFEKGIRLLGSLNYMLGD